MKKNKETKFKVKGPEGIEDGLMGMGRGICGARKNWGAGSNRVKQ